MDLASLQLFIDVVRLGSFTRVAKEHGLDPSSVSRAIAALEAELGIRLLQRTTRRLSLTEAGQIYLQQVEPLAEELVSAGEVARDADSAPRGRLRVTASESFGHKCLVPLLPRLVQELPELSVDLLLTDSNLDLVAERVDLAIRLAPRIDGTLVGRKLFDTCYRVCASPDYLAKNQRIDQPSDLTDHQCLLMPLRGYRTRWIFKDKQGKQRTVPVDGRIIVSNAMALRTCTLAGLGPVLLGNWLIDDDIASGALIDLFPDFRVTATDFETAAWLLYPSRSYLPQKVRAFIDFLTTEFAFLR